MSKIFVNYVIQNDPWESISEPNLYVLPGNYSNLNDVKAKIVYDSFPIKSQRFYLRFFLDDKMQDLKVWMDYPPSATIPVYTNKIFVKALRIPKKADEIKFIGEEIFKKTEVKKAEKKINIFDMENTNFDKKIDKKSEEKKPVENKNLNMFDDFLGSGNTVKNEENKNNSKNDTNIKDVNLSNNNKIFENMNVNLLDGLNESNSNNQKAQNNNNDNSFSKNNFEENFDFSGGIGQESGNNKAKNIKQESEEAKSNNFDENAFDFSGFKIDKNMQQQVKNNTGNDQKTNNIPENDNFANFLNSASTNTNTNTNTNQKKTNKSSISKIFLILFILN